MLSNSRALNHVFFVWVAPTAAHSITCFLSGFVEGCANNRATTHTRLLCVYWALLYTHTYSYIYMCTCTRPHCRDCAAAASPPLPAVFFFSALPCTPRPMTLLPTLPPPLAGRPACTVKCTKKNAQKHREEEKDGTLPPASEVLSPRAQRARPCTPPISHDCPRGNRRVTVGAAGCGRLVLPNEPHPPPPILPSIHV